MAVCTQSKASAKLLQRDRHDVFFVSIHKLSSCPPATSGHVKEREGQRVCVCNYRQRLAQDKGKRENPRGRGDASHDDVRRISRYISLPCTRESLTRSTREQDLVHDLEIEYHVYICMYIFYGFSPPLSLFLFCYKHEGESVARAPSSRLAGGWRCAQIVQVLKELGFLFRW